jgi:hypothetical protein
VTVTEPRLTVGLLITQYAVFSAKRYLAAHQLTRYDTAMPNPLPQTLLADSSYYRRKRDEIELARLQGWLTWLESGKFRLQSGAAGPMRDVTDDRIVYCRKMIGHYESRLRRH